MSACAEYRRSSRKLAADRSPIEAEVLVLTSIVSRTPPSMHDVLRALRICSLISGPPISPNLHENNLEALENKSTHLKPFLPFPRGSFQVVRDRVRELSEAR